MDGSRRAHIPPNSPFLRLYDGSISTSNISGNRGPGTGATRALAAPLGPATDSATEETRSSHHQPSSLDVLHSRPPSQLGSELDDDDDMLSPDSPCDGDIPRPSCLGVIVPAAQVAPGGINTSRLALVEPIPRLQLISQLQA